MATAATDQSPPPGENPQRPQAIDSADLPGAANPRSGVAALARRLHFLAGIAVAPFLVIMCLTGLANAFAPQIVNALHGRELFVNTEKAQPQLISDQVAAAITAHPGGDRKDGHPAS